MKGKMRRGCGGPCNHCGRTSSPCWRKGPPEKPVLCNACGARYLVKRSLEGYMPGQKNHKHAGKVSMDADSIGSSGQSTLEHRSVSWSPFSPANQNMKKRKEASRCGELGDIFVGQQCASSQDVGACVGTLLGPLCSSDISGHNEEDYMRSLAHIAASTLAMLRYSSISSTRSRCMKRRVLVAKTKRSCLGRR